MNMLGLIGFVVVMSGTPGPNNIMVASSAARFGVRATLPMVAGISLGCGVMFMLVGLGAGRVFVAWPVAWTIARWVAVAWLLRMAWAIAQAGAPGVRDGRPLGFLGAAAFQWINPKAWLMTLSAAAAFVHPDAGLLTQASVVAGTFLVLSLPCVLSWALLGAGAARLLSSAARVRVFNVAMAGLLVVSMIPVAFGE